MVPDDKVPAKRAEDTVAGPKVEVRPAMMVTAEALHEALGKKEPLVVVDARTPEAYKKGHIEGAVSFNVMAELRYPPDATPRAMTMKAPEELAALLGSRGIDRSVRVVVYDAGGLEAPFLAYALHRLGHDERRGARRRRRRLGEGGEAAAGRGRPAAGAGAEVRAGPERRASS